MATGKQVKKGEKQQDGPCHFGLCNSATRISIVRASIFSIISYESTKSFWAFASSSRHTCINSFNMMRA